MRELLSNWRRYIFLLGILMAQFTITGFDACGHMSEETKNADVSAAYGVVFSIITSAFVGFCYLLALTFSIQARPSAALVKC